MITKDDFKFKILDLLLLKHIFLLDNTNCVVFIAAEAKSPSDKHLNIKRSAIYSTPRDPLVPASNIYCIVQRVSHLLLYKVVFVFTNILVDYKGKNIKIILMVLKLIFPKLIRF